MQVVPDRGRDAAPTWRTADFAPLDAAWRRIASRMCEPPGGSLLAQTLATAVTRRPELEHMPVFPGASVLDLGTGYGAQLFELAHLWPIAAVGVDSDTEVVAAAASAVAELDGWFARGSSVHFAVGSAESLPLTDCRFDVAIVRLLFQHLRDPDLAISELTRVLRPGGAVYAFDVDDGLSITYPGASEPHARLEEAYERWQSGLGGDRYAGRKLAGRFAEAGYTIERVIAVPHAAFLNETPTQLERSVDLARLGAARGAIVAAGYLEGDEFDRMMEQFAAETADACLRVEAQLAVVARRPL